jgi:hypothetical protein
LEDFLKWYSPNDIKESVLSERMNLTDNLWKKIWDSAKPVKSTNQKSLFDHIREAELSLHYLEGLDMDQWMRYILISVFVTSYYTLRYTEYYSFKGVSEKLKNIKDLMIKIFESSAVYLFYIKLKIIRVNSRLDQ